jgi:regulator of protease activity HflC (stomatin/prohibitin superfamily)
MPVGISMGTLTAGAAIFFLFIVAFMAIKIVPEYMRIVVLRLGKYNATKGPGLVFIWPMIDQPIWADLRENFLEIPQQTCITKDNAPIAIDFLIYWKVLDPAHSVLAVRNFMGAAQGVAMTTLRAVIGDIPLDDVLAKRDQINHVLRAKLDEVTERWGVKVTTVEIREIQPPREVQDAMNKQMAAERNRRAMVLEADGKKQAAITIAEGEKQSAILKAEGDRQAAVLRAEGYALALQKIFDTAKGLDAKTMALQYLETLKVMGQGESTKWIIPMELANLVQPFVKNLQGAGDPK